MEYMTALLRSVFRRVRRSPDQSLLKYRLLIWDEIQNLNEAATREHNLGVNISEYTLVALVVAYAIVNPLYVKWDAEQLADKANATRFPTEEAVTKDRKKLENYFPFQSLGFQRDPCTLVDIHGRILIWHLPEVLRKWRLDDYHDAIISIKGELEIKTSKSSSWRDHGYHPGDTFGAGNLTLSPGWFMQGRDQIHEPLRASTSSTSPAAARLMASIAQVESICDAVVCLTAPELYHSGIESIKEVKSGNLMAHEYENTDMWPSCYTGIQFIVNRITPPHRDAGGAPTDYDLLVSAGTHTSARLKIREENLELSYNPGTMVLLSGKLLTHEVPLWEGEERICVAHFMKDAVHNHLQIPRPPYPRQDSYFQMFRQS